MSSRVFVNAIATACPANDFQSLFAHLMPVFLKEKERSVFARLIARSQIDHRYCCLPVDGSVSSFYRASADPFPTTGVRMQQYKQHAPQLAHQAAIKLGQKNLRGITHVVVGSCTGFYAPGVDFDLIKSLGLDSTVQRRIVGFMGCYAGLSVLQTAFEIVRSTPESRVLTVNIELCSLHLQKPDSLEDAMGFAQFADGCAAAVVSAEPTGLQLHGFCSNILGIHAPAITWDITDQGFAMHLDAHLPAILNQHFPIGMFPDRQNTAMWAIHPGGRSILDVVQKRLELPDESVCISREILRRFGNMSSATVLYVLKEMLDADTLGSGYAMAFGPGLAIESMRFSRANPQ